MTDYLDFEKPLRQLEERIARLVRSGSQKQSVQDTIRKSKARLAELEIEVYGNLTPWQRSQLARHPQRPSMSDYVSRVAQKFLEFHGDRLFKDDRAILGGFATVAGRPVMLIGQEKGKTLKDRMRRNFGMPNPEGYRKALRLMKLAEKFHRPIITFIDTPGAYPGIEAEQRGQAEAIARNLMAMARLRVPTIAVITGEGGSGGALALAASDRVIMLEHAIFSVISPEGCAAILWNDASKAPDAARALKMTAQDLHELGLIDDIVPEPLGGAHRDVETMATRLGHVLEKHLCELEILAPETLLSRRDAKYRRMPAQFAPAATATARTTRS